MRWLQLTGKQQPQENKLSKNESQPLTFLETILAIKTTVAVVYIGLKCQIEISEKR